MGHHLYQSTISVSVKHESSSERTRIRSLNARFEQLCKEFEDLNLMIFGFDPADFVERHVRATKSGKVEIPAWGAIIEYRPGTIFDHDFAVSNGIEFIELPDEPRSAPPRS